MNDSIVEFCVWFMTICIRLGWVFKVQIEKNILRKARER